MIGCHEIDPAIDIPLPNETESTMQGLPKQSTGTIHEKKGTMNFLEPGPEVGNMGEINQQGIVAMQHDLKHTAEEKALAHDDTEPISPVFMVTKWKPRALRNLKRHPVQLNVSGTEPQSKIEPVDVKDSLTDKALSPKPVATGPITSAEDTDRASPRKDETDEEADALIIRPKVWQNSPTKKKLLAFSISKISTSTPTPTALKGLKRVAKEKQTHVTKIPHQLQATVEAIEQEKRKMHSDMVSMYERVPRPKQDNAEITLKGKRHLSSTRRSRSRSRGRKETVARSGSGGDASSKRRSRSHSRGRRDFMARAGSGNADNEKPRSDRKARRSSSRDKVQQRRSKIGSYEETRSVSKGRSRSISKEVRNADIKGKNRSGKQDKHASQSTFKSEVLSDVRQKSGSPRIKREKGETPIRERRHDVIQGQSTDRSCRGRASPSKRGRTASPDKKQEKALERDSSDDRKDSAKSEVEGLDSIKVEADKLTDWSDFKKAGYIIDEFRRMKLRSVKYSTEEKIGNPMPIFNYLSFPKKTMSFVVVGTGTKKHFAEKALRFTKNKPILHWSQSPIITDDFYYMCRSFLLANTDEINAEIFQTIADAKDIQYKNSTDVTATERKWYPRVDDLSFGEVDETEHSTNSWKSGDGQKKRKVSLVEYDSGGESPPVVVANVQIDVVGNVLKVKSKWDSDNEDNSCDPTITRKPNKQIEAQMDNVMVNKESQRLELNKPSRPAEKVKEAFDEVSPKRRQSREAVDKKVYHRENFRSEERERKFDQKSPSQRSMQDKRIKGEKPSDLVLPRTKRSRHEQESPDRKKNERPSKIEESVMTERSVDLCAKAMKLTSPGKNVDGDNSSKINEKCAKNVLENPSDVSDQKIDPALRTTTPRHKHESKGKNVHHDSQINVTTEEASGLQSKTKGSRSEQESSGKDSDDPRNFNQQLNVVAAEQSVTRRSRYEKEPSGKEVERDNRPKDNEKAHNVASKKSPDRRQKTRKSKSERKSLDDSGDDQKKADKKTVKTATDQKSKAMRCESRTLAMNINRDSPLKINLPAETIEKPSSPESNNRRLKYGEESQEMNANDECQPEEKPAKRAKKSEANVLLKNEHRHLVGNEDQESHKLDESPSAVAHSPTNFKLSFGKDFLKQAEEHDKVSQLELVRDIIKPRVTKKNEEPPQTDASEVLRKKKSRFDRKPSEHFLEEASFDDELDIKTPEFSSNLPRILENSDFTLEKSINVELGSPNTSAKVCEPKEAVDTYAVNRSKSDIQRDYEKPLKSGPIFDEDPPEMVAELELKKLNSGRARLEKEERRKLKIERELSKQNKASLEQNLYERKEMYAETLLGNVNLTCGKEANQNLHSTTTQSVTKQAVAFDLQGSLRAERDLEANNNSRRLTTNSPDMADSKELVSEYEQFLKLVSSESPSVKPDIPCEVLPSRSELEKKFAAKTEWDHESSSQDERETANASKNTGIIKQEGIEVRKPVAMPIADVDATENLIVATDKVNVLQRKREKSEESGSSSDDSDESSSTSSAETTKGRKNKPKKKSKKEKKVVGESSSGDSSESGEAPQKKQKKSSKQKSKKVKKKNLEKARLHELNEQKKNIKKQLAELDSEKSEKIIKKQLKKLDKELKKMRKLSVPKIGRKGTKLKKRKKKDSSSSESSDSSDEKSIRKKKKKKNKTKKKRSVSSSSDDEKKYKKSKKKDKTTKNKKKKATRKRDRNEDNDASPVAEKKQRCEELLIAGNIPIIHDDGSGWEDEAEKGDGAQVEKQLMRVEEPSRRVMAWVQKQMGSDWEEIESKENWEKTGRSDKAKELTTEELKTSSQVAGPEMRAFESVGGLSHVGPCAPSQIAVSASSELYSPTAVDSDPSKSFSEKAESSRNVVSLNNYSLNSGLLASPISFTEWSVRHGSPGRKMVLADLDLSSTLPPHCKMDSQLRNESQSEFPLSKAETDVKSLTDSPTSSIALHPNENSISTSEENIIQGDVVICNDDMVCNSPGPGGPVPRSIQPEDIYDPLAASDISDEEKPLDVPLPPSDIPLPGQHALSDIMLPGELPSPVPSEPVRPLVTAPLPSEATKTFIPVNAPPGTRSPLNELSTSQVPAAKSNRWDIPSSEPSVVGQASRKVGPSTPPQPDSSVSCPPRTPSPQAASPNVTTPTVATPSPLFSVKLIPKLQSKVASVFEEDSDESSTPCPPSAAAGHFLGDLNLNKVTVEEPERSKVETTIAERKTESDVIMSDIKDEQYRHDRVKISKEETTRHPVGASNRGRKGSRERERKIDRRDLDVGERGDRSRKCRRSKSPPRRDLRRYSKSPDRRRRRSPSPRRRRLSPPRRVSSRAESPKRRRSRSRSRSPRGKRLRRRSRSPIQQSSRRSRSRSPKTSKRSRSRSPLLKRRCDSPQPPPRRRSPSSPPQRPSTPENHPIPVIGQPPLPSVPLHQPSDTPQRLSLDQRIELELGLKLHDPPPASNSGSPSSFYSPFVRPPPCRFGQPPEQPPLHPGPIMHTGVPIHPDHPMHLPQAAMQPMAQQIVQSPMHLRPMMVHPDHPMGTGLMAMHPAMSMPPGPPMQWCSTISTPQQGAVLQVGNIMEVVPSIHPPPPPPPPPPKSQQQIVQVGNVLQVVPSVRATAVVAPTLASQEQPVITPADALQNPLIKAIQAEREKRRKEKEVRKDEREARRRARQFKRSAKLMTVAEKRKNSVRNEGLMLGQDTEDEELLLEALEPPSPPGPVEVVVEYRDLPPAGKGILISPGIIKQKDNMEKKGVKFADGFLPGEASTSGGEDRKTPPPKSKIPKEKRLKKKLKRKVKVHIIRHIVQSDDEDDDLPPPPPPPGDPPPILYATFPFGGQVQYPVYQTSVTTTTVTTVQFPKPPVK